MAHSRRRTIFSTSVFVAVAASVGASGCARVQPDAAPATAPSESAPEAAPERVAFENPGGMWMPAQLTGQAETLRGLGVAFDPELLTDPTSPLLGAIVSLGGCTGSFVSKDGLLITNHHCVRDALQYNSSPERNLLEGGFVARTRAEERHAGPTSRVYVTTSFTDVTREVLGGTESISDPLLRYQEIDRRRKELRNACEKGKPAIRCPVSSFFEGAQFFRIEQLEIKDVRLVYAPHEGVGYFGGDEDNWQWPRHTGDFAFLRAYVGKDGAPAPFSADNVPYQPPTVLRVQPEGPKPGEFVMVAGYPGQTYRLKTAYEVQEAVSFAYPRRLAVFDERMAMYQALVAGDEALRIKADGAMFRMSNAQKNNRGLLEGLTKGHLAEDRVKLEQDLRAWIAAAPERVAKYGRVFDEMAEIRRGAEATRDRDAAAGDVLGASSLLRQAFDMLRLASERAKPDAERKAGFQNSDLDRHEQSTRRLSKTYDPKLDRAELELFLKRALRESDTGRPEAVLRGFVPKGPLTEEALLKAVAKLYEGTKLGDEATRVRLLREGTTKSLAASKDPFIALARRLVGVRDELEERSARREGALATLRPIYIEALRAHAGRDVAPDANGTLRVTYGTVRGYRPRPGADVYTPFTTLREMVAKHRGKAPFSAPESILAAARGPKGPYTDAALGDVPVDFLADLDITGGNSGSPTLNAKGELVGVVFDGNYEAMANDWVFLPELTRSIHMDIRYGLWILDAVDDADHLIAEMGLQPGIGPTGAPAGAAKVVTSAP